VIAIRILSKLNKFVAEVNDLLVYVASEEIVSLEDAEVHVSKTFRSLAQMFLEMCVSQQAGEKVSEPISCPECDTPCSALRLQKKDFSTLCGKIGICRWVYQCEQGHRHAPWDAKQQLLDKYTRRVAEMMCCLGMQLDFREAADELSRQGIEVSHTTLHQKVGEWSADLSVPEQVDTQTLRDNERWYVSCDGCHTNSPDGWKETKVGCVYRDYAQLGSGATPSARTESIRYVAERENAEQFGLKLFALATQSGIYRDAIDKILKRLCLLGMVQRGFGT
jgi:hypothetical protein